MNKTLWDDIWHLITRRGWLNRIQGNDGDNYWYEFYSKDQGVPSIRIHIYVYARDGRIFINASDPNLSTGRVAEFLEVLRQLFATFDGVLYNQENGVFCFRPKAMPRPNIVEVEQAIDLCINAVRHYHRALNSAKQAIIDSRDRINP